MGRIRPTYARAPRAPMAVLAGAIALSACAHAPPAPVAPPVDGELARLRAELAQRDQAIIQLEGRLSLAEAGQRQLRAELERVQGAQPAPHETVRIGGRKPPAEAPVLEPAPMPSSEPRPVLRLSGDRRGESRELTSSWTPPVTSERLSVVPLPAAPNARRPQAMPMTESAPAPAAGDDLYVRAIDLLRRREFAEAVREFDAFVKLHPEDPRVGRAQFFRGELLFAERDYKRALAAFDQSLARDPNGDKAPDAMLRSALCQLQLGARERARAILASLRARFPDSDAAQKAAQLMQENSG